MFSDQNVLSWFIFIGGFMIPCTINLLFFSCYIFPPVLKTCVAIFLILRGRVTSPWFKKLRLKALLLEVSLGVIAVPSATHPRDQCVAPVRSPLMSVAKVRIRSMASAIMAAPVTVVRILTSN